MKAKEQKLDVEKIVNAGQKIYRGYLLLDMINDEKNNYFTINNKKGLSLSKYVTKLVKKENASEFHRQIQIGKKHCKIQIKKVMIINIM